MRKKRQKRKDIDSLLIFYYSKILRKNTRSFLFLPLADMYRRKGMPELAIQICLRGLKVHPDYISARMLLGLSYYDCERLDDAERELRIVADSVADNILARRVLSDIYRKKGRIDDALKEIEVIISIIPDNKNFQIIKEGLQKLQKHYQKASQPATLTAHPSEIQTNSTKAELKKKPAVQIATISDEKNSGEIDDFENLLDDEGALEEIERLFPSKVKNLSEKINSADGAVNYTNSDIKIDTVKVLNSWLKNIENR